MNIIKDIPTESDIFCKNVPANPEGKELYIVNISNKSGKAIEKIIIGNTCIYIPETFQNHPVIKVTFYKPERKKKIKSVIEKYQQLKRIKKITFKEHYFVLHKLFMHYFYTGLNADIDHEIKKREMVLFNRIKKYKLNRFYLSIF